MSIPDFGVPINLDPKAISSLALFVKGDQRLPRLVAELSLGDVISGEVIETDGDGAIRLSIRGETVQARSALEVKPGSTLTLRLVSTAPQPTFQLVSYQPAELSLTSLASLALSSPTGMAPLLERLGALTRALRTLLSGDSPVADQPIGQEEHPSGDAASKSSGQSNPAGPSRAAQLKTLTTMTAGSVLPEASLPPALSSPANVPATADVLQSSSREAMPTSEAAPQLTGKSNALPTTRAAHSSPLLLQRGAINQTEPSGLPAEAFTPLPTTPQVRTVLAGLERALARSSLDPRMATAESVREAMLSLGEPIEHSLRALLEAPEQMRGSESAPDLKSALIRTLQHSSADGLPDAIKQLAAHTAGQLEAKQALNVLAMAHGQLLFELPVQAPGGWKSVEILVEKDGGGDAEDGADERGTQVTLQLSPDGLGPLRLLTRFSGDEVSCYLACADGEVAEFIEARLPELRLGLEQQGLEVKALQAVVVPNTPEAFAPLAPSRLLAKPLLDARV